MIKTYNRIKQVFPTEGVTATVVVKADDVRSGEAAAGIENLRRQLQASIYPPGPDITYSEDGTVAKIDVATPGTGTDAPSTDALNEIRDDIIPATMGGVDGASVNVTGDAAASVDFRDQLNSRLPLIFAFVFGLAFILFLVTFRSIVIPIKAILLNLLSVGAAYGVLVLVFQNGNLESLLGFTSNGGVASWLPLFLFVILFGLSMDYHVFILSRVRELHDRGMPTDEAVREGIAATASTVTSAAIVMVGVFACLRDAGLPRLQGAWGRLGGGGADRRDDRARDSAARIDASAGRLELVPAEVARVASACRHGGGRGRSVHAARSREQRACADSRLGRR